MSNQTLFIADLHLSPNSSATKNIFDQITAAITPETDALYILGDLFEFWVGDDLRSTFNEEVKANLKKISEKTKLYVMHGNRDFLLGETFAKETGSTLIPDPYLLNLYGRQTILTHGDTLCSNDTSYLIFRTMIRAPFGLKLFLKLPLAIRTWIAKNIRKHTRKTVQKKTKDTFAPQLDTTKKLLKKLSASQVIHGHIHREEVEEFTVNGEKNIRISVGAWESRGSILIYRSDHTYEFKNPTIT